MSRLPSVPILEWSPKGCRVIDPSTAKIVESDTAAGALALAGNPRQIVLALARRQTFLRAVRLPDVGHAEAKNILAFQLEETFPVDTEDLCFDLEFTDDRNQDGRLAIVVAVRADVLRQAKADLAEAGTKPVRTVPAFLGSAEFAKGSGHDPCLVIDESPEGTTFDVVRQAHVVYSRTAPGAVKGDALEAEIVRTLASAQLASAPAISGRDYGTPTVEVRSGRDPALALTHVSTHYDLVLPEELAKVSGQAVTRRRNLAVLILGAAFALGALFWLDRDDLQREVDAKTSRWDRELERLEDIKRTLDTRLSDVDGKWTLVNSAAKPKQHASDVYIAVANAAVEGVWLTGVSFERGRPLTIRGTARSSDQVAAYVGALNLEPRFRDVTLAFSNEAEIEETPVVQFSITAHVVGNFPLEDPPQERSRSASARNARP